MGKSLIEQVGYQDVLHWERSRQGDADVFRCGGAFSLVSHEQFEPFRGQILSSDAKRIVLDMREVAYMDSAGLGVLAMIVKHLLPTARPLVIIPSPQVKNLLVASGMDRVILFAESIPAALDVQPE